MEFLEKVGIFGGTFDPPHIGHLVMARRAVEQLELKKVFFVPANIPPHKNLPIASAEHRLNMIRLAVIPHKDFEVSTCEIERGGISYTIDTIRFFLDNVWAKEFYLLIGEDSAIHFSSWKESEEIKKLVKICWFPRICEGKNPIPPEFIKIDAEILDISSSRIRKLIKEGKSVKYLVPEPVLEYIKINKLYI
jgi:nicotinate-nucleotide adenylyltransferase